MKRFSMTRYVIPALGYVLFMMFFVGPVFCVPPKVDIPPLNFKPGQAERTQLKNGIVVYILEDHELPLFNMNIRLKTSPADEAVPDSFSFLSSQWRAGGTKTRTPSKLNEELEQLAAAVETSADNESASVSLACLSKDIPKGTELFADVLFNPAFDQEQLVLAQSKTLEALRRKNETPNQIARRAFRDVAYGPDHIYSQEPTEKSVEKMTRASLIDLHERILSPDHAMVAVSGDFKKEELLAQLETLFASWASNDRLVPQYDYSVKNPSSGKFFFVNKEANQSRITMGRLGPARHNPDHFSLMLTDYILGGGGPSRLFGEIRSRMGLAYMVGSFVQEPAGPGLIGVACLTKSASTIQAVQAIQSELDKFSNGPISIGEIRLAKESTVNSMVFGFDSPWDVVNARASNEFLGYPPDYLDTAADRLLSISKEEIAKVAKRYYNKESMKVLIVGDESKLGLPLDSLGAVTKIPLSDIR